MDERIRELLKNYEQKSGKEIPAEFLERFWSRTMTHEILKKALEDNLHGESAEITEINPEEGIISYRNSVNGNTGTLRLSDLGYELKWVCVATLSGTGKSYRYFKSQGSKS